MTPTLPQLPPLQIQNSSRKGWVSDGSGGRGGEGASPWRCPPGERGYKLGTGWQLLPLHTPISREEPREREGGGPLKQRRAWIPNRAIFISKSRVSATNKSRVSATGGSSGRSSGSRGPHENGSPPSMFADSRWAQGGMMGPEISGSNLAPLCGDRG